MMEPIPYNTTVKVVLTVEELAYAVAHLDSSEHARFISQVAEIVNGWDNPLEMQLQYITDDPLLTKAGRSLMEHIGDYAWPLPD